MAHEGQPIDRRDQCIQAQGWHKDQELYLWGHNDTLAQWHKGKSNLYRDAWNNGASCAWWRAEPNPAGHTAGSGWNAWTGP